MAKKSSLYVILVILIVILVGLVAAVIVWRYFLSDREDPAVICSSDAQCDLGTTCVNGTCEVIKCTTSVDCIGSQACISGFCIEKNCSSNSDCTETGEACSNGVCVPYGQVCNTSTDCNNGAMQCIGGKCSQCTTNADCSIGYCNGGLCTNSCTNACPQDQVCVPNKQQTCCPTAPECGQACTAGGTGSCQYCVNNIRTCTKGTTFDICTEDKDCVSGKCFMGTSLGNVCSYVDSQFCVTNYNGTNTTPGSCDSSKPFCVRGTCSDIPLGAPCGDNNSCRTINLNVADVNTVVPPKKPYAYYCTNGFCSREPAKLGEKCHVTDDCVYAQKASNSQTARLQCISGTCQ